MQGAANPSVERSAAAAAHLKHRSAARNRAPCETLQRNEELRADHVEHGPA